MNQVDIIRMAREAGGDDWGLLRDFMPELERFAQMVEAETILKMQKNFCANLRQMHDAIALSSLPGGLRARNTHE
mgnify:CR=1 FL=1|jgi:hypothetical protein